MSFQHTTVLLQETVAALAPQRGGCYLDGTFGGGGHSRLLLEQCAPTGRVIGLDRDADAIANGQALVAQMAGRLTLVKAPFAQVAEVLQQLEIAALDGAMLDLGVSSHQLDTAERGFSFIRSGPLDMRMDGDSTTPTAAALLNTLDADALADIFFHYGEERHARRIARMVVKVRQQHPFTTTTDLAERIAHMTPGYSRIHPATRVFQGLRIAVNEELQQLEQALSVLIGLLKPGGHLAVISFHSLEDRIVKRLFRDAAKPPEDPVLRGLPIAQAQRPKATLKLVHNKPLTPSEAEIEQNPRARSAKLRVAQKLA
ncbi:S-adenosyl-methyltransferase MraW [Magnetococcus marinus MC-1]|uniref:Ribosomal RNA small subunit methyltransferase H n=1 Tax=Magnetococcus marinus (strain ATCC BAA-1437 / JCM 17883 / MC-1) TaxID=156889 RepID=RSMH_MAGMM|nr:16S rRNA (cytosine(1402)-N(4))-methyltransferase RsmH [Magnetococcus marinus]A0L5N9.1 RecName: Full=Ribosomal RNA small subunit methyltransferase H; AltName: Full=16S rRNA m(4)C1402 methyltransferase; AltName: Full=rRNA (cytosine-N(4)-)-methyltransferase RsmH [Magnetococcus marinus MC-1]ABK43282.1 S-adenosyl-methyltransferase MraW [Magnetococcus marinus MC-1]